MYITSLRHQRRTRGTAIGNIYKKKIGEDRTCRPHSGYACGQTNRQTGTVILITTTICDGTATGVKMIKLPNLPKPTI